jgi:succinate-acetate transporter protein
MARARAARREEGSMAIAVDRPAVTLVEATPAADPAPLGLAAFALTTFVLSGHNASFIPDLIWIGLALFYGGMAQLLAGMWEFRNRNVFGATAFSTYGGFWMSLGIFVVLAVVSKSFGGALTGANLPNAVAWFLLAFAIFNTYMLLWSSQVTVAVFLVFLTLEITEILLVIGNFDEAHGHANNWWIHAGGWVGIVTAAVAWYTSAAGVINGMKAPHVVLPVGSRLPVWKASPMPRGQQA